MFFIKHADKVSLKCHVLFMVFHMKLNWGKTSLSLGHLQNNRLSGLEKNKKNEEKHDILLSEQENCLRHRERMNKGERAQRGFISPPPHLLFLCGMRGFFGWWFGVFVWVFFGWFLFFCDGIIWAILVDESMINCKSMDVS